MYIMLHFISYQCLMNIADMVIREDYLIFSLIDICRLIYQDDIIRNLFLESYQLIMSYQSQQNKSGLVLPPLYQCSHLRTPNKIMKGYMKLIRRKKSQLSGYLHRKPSQQIGGPIQYPNNIFNINNENQNRNAITQSLKKEITPEKVSNDSLLISKTQIFPTKKIKSRQSRYVINQYKSHFKTPSNSKKRPIRVKSLLFQGQKQDYKTSIKQDNIKLSNNLDNIQTKNIYLSRKAKPIVQQIVIDQDKSEQSIKQIKQILLKYKSQSMGLLHNQTFYAQQQSKVNSNKQEKSLNSNKNIHQVHERSYKQLKMTLLFEKLKLLKTHNLSEIRIEEVITLQSFNPFFKNIDRVISQYLLKIGQIQHKHSGQTLYEMQLQYTCFYIILSGKIIITSFDNTKNILQTGQILLQHNTLLKNIKNEGNKMVILERAIIEQQSWLLKIDIKLFKILHKFLISNGFGQQFERFTRMIKKFSINKWRN